MNYRVQRKNLELFKQLKSKGNTTDRLEGLTPPPARHQESTLATQQNTVIDDVPPFSTEEPPININEFQNIEE